MGPRLAVFGTKAIRAEACTWPDRPRKRAEEHFINVPRTLQTIAATQCPAVPKCLFAAFVVDREVVAHLNRRYVTYAN